VRRAVRADRVAEPALLADLVEQPRAHRAAEQRGVDREGGALLDVGRVEVGPPVEPQVRLLGVAALDLHAALEGRGRVGLRRAARAGEAGQQLAGALAVEVREVAREERAAAGGGPLALAEGEDAVAREGAQVLLGTEHRAAERVLAVGGGVDQVVGDRGRHVVGPGDLLDHDPALAVELLAVDPRAADEVRQQVERGHDRLRPARDVERHDVVRRVGVELRAEPLGGLVHVAVGRERLAALEDQVLEEVGHPVLLGPLGAGSGVERHERRDRPGARDREAHERQAGLQLAMADVDHPAQGSDGHG
jgi:hypothetical protein